MSEKFPELVEKLKNSTLSDQEKIELASFIINKMKEIDGSLRDALSIISLDTGIDLSVDIIKTLLDEVCSKNLLSDEECNYVKDKETEEKRSRATRSRKQKKDEEEKKEPSLDVSIVRELANYQRQYGGEKENVVGNLQVDNNNVAFLSTKILLHPLVVSAYNILKNYYVEINGRRIPLINASIGVSEEKEVGLVSFVNTAVLNYLKMIGIIPGITLSQDFKDIIKGVYGIDVDLPEFVTPKIIYVSPKRKEVVRENEVA